MVLPPCTRHRRRACRQRAAALAATSAAAAVPAALALGGIALAPAPVHAAAPGPDLRILSPRKGDQFGSATFAIDVRFQGRSAAQAAVAAEVWVNGVRWTRHPLAGQMRGDLRLELDGSSLPAGKHVVLVKLFAADGSVSSKTVTVEAGNNAGVAVGNAGAPAGAERRMAFRGPINGTRVSGVVNIDLDVADRNSGAATDPYVTFYVNNEFKTLKNFAPYIFSWDTTGLPNGLHTVEATAFWDNNSAPAKRRLRVYVDNPGGNTARLPDIPDLRPSATPPAKAAGARPAAPLVIPTPKKSAPVASRGSGTAPRRVVAAAPVSGAAEVAIPAARSVIAPSEPANWASAPLPPAMPESLGVKAGASRVAAIAAPGLRLAVPDAAVAAPAARPAPLVAATPSPSTPSPATPPRPVLPAVVAPASPAKPAPPAGLVVKTANRSVAVASPIRPASGAPPAAARPARSTIASAPTTGLTRMARSVRTAAPRAHRVADGQIQVAFNGQRIAFDVPPRVEAGLPVAPFRHIFEHTGGRVSWVPETRVVRAVDAEREIVITVGKKVARVNDKNVVMTRAATLEQGRTVVPLTFVGHALDVDVQYDPATGRLLITSKK